MAHKESQNNKTPNKSDYKTEKHLNTEAMDAIFRLYDKTFRDLAKR